MQDTEEWSVRLCVYMCVSYVTLVHPTKTIGRDTHVVPSNIVLDKGHGPSQKREICRSEPPFAAMPPIAKLLWSL